MFLYGQIIVKNYSKLLLINNHLHSQLSNVSTSSHIGQVLRLSGAVSPDMLLNVPFRTALTVPEVVDVENQSPQSANSVKPKQHR